MTEPIVPGDPRYVFVSPPPLLPAAAILVATGQLVSQVLRDIVKDVFGPSR